MKTKEKITELEQKIGELTAGWQRTQADFVNFRKQVEQDKAKWRQDVRADFICELLPILDNFQLAAKHAPAELENNSWAQGIKQIEKQLENLLTSEGLEKIESVGSEFNPHLHEAIEHIPSKEPENTVIEELCVGYTLNGEVLRSAKVKVSKGKK